MENKELELTYKVSKLMHGMEPHDKISFFLTGTLSVLITNLKEPTKENVIKYFKSYCDSALETLEALEEIKDASE